MKRNQVDIEKVLERVDSIFAAPEFISSGKWFQMMWPWIFATAFAGIAFELTKYAIFEIRRHIYNSNRNLKHVSKNRKKSAKDQNFKYAKKNQTWRTLPEGKKQGESYHKIPLPLPPM